MTDLYFLNELLLVQKNYLAVVVLDFLSKAPHDVREGTEGARAVPKTGATSF